MFDFDEILRGYTDRQYAEALVDTLITFLVDKNIISAGEYVSYRKEHFNDILEKIIKRDREELEEWIKKKSENQ